LSYHWPDFNVADSAVVTGACLLLLDSLRNREHAIEVASENEAGNETGETL
jgi:lipoprotein signal peptidase